ncbi:hypothetical protein HQ533_04530 [Candidatus Woesearchaeota archaeon]|nr:hypothetical protein [Candidatus Woesearchaeota archaeon]
MGEFDQVKFKKFVLEQEVVGIKPEVFTLKSKRESHWYINWRDVTNNAATLYELAKHVIAFNWNVDDKSLTYYGVPEGATKIGVVMSHIESSPILKDPQARKTLNPDELTQIAGNIIDKTKSLDPDCFIGYPAYTPARELGLITQFEWAKSHNFSLEKSNLPMFRTVTKSHGDEKDQNKFVGMPKGKTVLVIDGDYAKEEIFESLFTMPNTEIVGVVYTGLNTKDALTLGAFNKTPQIKGLELFFVNEPSLYDLTYDGIVQIEDVTTTGTSSLASAHHLRDSGINVVRQIALSNRMEYSPIPGLDDDAVVEAFRKIYESASGLEYPGGMSVAQAFTDSKFPYHAMLNAPDILPTVFKQSGHGPELGKAIQEEFETYGLQELKLGGQ